jgi:hypothetical protein
MGAASKNGQFEQFHFDSIVKIAPLLLTGSNEYVFNTAFSVQWSF